MKFATFVRGFVSGMSEIFFSETNEILTLRAWRVTLKRQEGFNE